jgi:hypothetical protein
MELVLGDVFQRHEFVDTGIVHQHVDRAEGFLVSSNSRCTSAALATSPLTAMALPPFALMSATTRSAPSLLEEYSPPLRRLPHSSPWRWPRRSPSTHRSRPLPCLSNRSWNSSLPPRSIAMKSSREALWGETTRRSAHRCLCASALEVREIDQIDRYMTAQGQPNDVGISLPRPTLLRLRRSRSISV